MAIAERVRRLQPDGGPAVPYQERRDRHVQPIQLFRLQEHRDGDAATLHEQTGAAARSQQLDHLGDRYARIVVVADANHGRKAEALTGRPRERPRADVEGFRRRVAEDAMVLTKAPRGIENDA